MRHVLPAFSALAAVWLILYGAIYLQDGNVGLGLLYALSLVAVAANALYYWLTRRLQAGSNVMAGVGLLVLLSTFAQAPFGAATGIWLVAYVVFVMFLTGTRFGTAWVAAILVGCAIIVGLDAAGTLAVPYDFVSIVNLFFATAITYVLMFVFMIVLQGFEQDLRQRVAQLDEAQTVGRIGSWTWDIPTNRVSWSDQMYRVYGYEPGGLAVDYQTFLKLVHPEDRDVVNAKVQDSYVTLKPFQFQHRALRPDGKLRWLESRGQVLAGRDGKPATMFGTGQDITPMKAAEERSRRLIESSPDALVITDDQGLIVQVNQEAERLFGYSRTELVGSAVEKLIPTPLRDVHISHRASYMKNPKARPMGANRALRAVRKDGGEFPVEISLSPIETPDGVMVMSAVRDVSERQRVMKEREELELLRQVNEFRSQFINMAAHELNTPLTPLKLQVDILKDPDLAPEQRAHSIQVLERNLERVAHLVQNMLDVGRIQSGRIQFQAGPMDLNAAVVETLESFEELAKQLGVKLETSITGDLYVDADSQRLGQVLLNLVNNALKFTPPGGRVLVETEIIGKDAAVRVKDTGLGLTSDQIAKLFRPFSQVHAAVQTATKPGTGLGLYISRQLVELHGGRLWVESGGPDNGSTFEFRIPMTAPKVAVNDGEAGPEKEGQKAAVPAQQRHDLENDQRTTRRGR